MSEKEERREGEGDGRQEEGRGKRQLIYLNNHFLLLGYQILSVLNFFLIHYILGHICYYIN